MKASGVREAQALTQREKEVADLVAQGLKNRAIGHKLGIAERTVKNHLQSIFDKLGVANRLELALRVIGNRPPGEA